MSVELRLDKAGTLKKPRFIGRSVRLLLGAASAYVYGHLGLSMLLAAVIGTPGCEMRAIPHLWTIISGKQTAEHYCPGFLNRLDNWESRKQE